MHMVIKDAKTIEEYKAVRTKMEELTKRYSSRHKEAVENWENGEPVKAWTDSQKHLCIEYESGKYWHYNEKGQWW